MRTALAIVILVASTVLAHADPLDDILARNLAARGGAEKLRAIRSLRATGKAVLGGGSSSITAELGQVIERPNRVRTEVTLQGLTQISASNGGAAWTLSPFGGRRDAELASVDDKRQIDQSAELDGPLVDWRTKGHRLEWLGTENVDGTPAIKLRVTRKDGDTQYVFIDPDSALEIRITTVRTVRGSEEITETDLGEYAQVAGVWLPFSLESGAPGQARSYRVKLSRIEVNVATEPAWFQVPTATTTRVAVAGPAAKPSAVATAPTMPTAPASIDAGTIAGLGARNIGSAAMSGRIAAVAAVNVGGQTHLFVGAASGGVWRSLDSGTTFTPVFDRQAVQSIGAITIDPKDPKTIWVGTGEAWTRNSVSLGDGIYRSTDNGETWTNLGLKESERIVKIVVSPRDSNTVFACVPGKLWSDSKERGLYRTSDGGKSWSLVLPGSNLSTGCSGVSIDPANPDAMLAGMWDFRRQGWTFRSGGAGPDEPSGSGMFRSSDGGRTWTSIATEKGLPPGPWGRVEVTHAPSNGKIVYALIESKHSALYRSNDGGATWERRDQSSKMVWRPFYFARLVVDPTNPERLFKPDLGLIVSEDGGKSFADSGGGSHGDWHDLWIDPQHPKHVIGGDDGGLWLSYDGGSKWFKENNLPVSQFYHVSVDDQDPYQVYGGLQDNSSWVGDSAFPGGVTSARWTNLCNGDGFWAWVDPTDHDKVYCESQGGAINRVDRKTMASRDIQPKAGYHEKLRFNWNTPVALSPTQKATLYLGAQFLFRSRDRGDTWQRISPDLTTNDPQKQLQEKSGGVTIDNSSAEMHTTIYTISESPKNSSVIWAGTDDGNLQLTRDGGATWTNVVANVPELPKYSWVSWVEASRFEAGTAYVTFDRHTVGDMAPWVFVTTDFGKTWKRLADRVRGYAHTIKEDAVKPNILFLGTEFGLWISVDRGATFARFEGNNFPSVAVREIQIQPRDGDLVIATHGRGIWIIDDLTPLRALGDALAQQAAAFLPTRTVQQRMPASGGWVEGDAAFVGENPPSGMVITYYLRTRHIYGPLELEVRDAAGTLVDTVTPSKHRGINRVVWNMHVKGPRVPRAAQVAYGSLQGARIVPGTYTIVLARGADRITTKVTVGLDRRAPYTVADRKAEFAAMQRAAGLFEDMSKLVDRIEATREALEQRAHAVASSDPLHAKLLAALVRLAETKKLIVATTEGGAITGEHRIREHLDELYGALSTWEGRPAKYQLERIEVLRRELGDASNAYDQLFASDVRALDGALQQHQLQPVPAVTAISARDHADELDDLAIQCLSTRGRDCKGDDPAAERD